MSGWRVAQHPASLDGLVPKELAAVPNSANGYPFAYYAPEIGRFLLCRTRDSRMGSNCLFPGLAIGGLLPVWT